ncbi:S8 family serine peptidase [Chloroflexota bacterium]
MRYTIVGATPEQVQNAGASDIKVTRSTGIIFAVLTADQVQKLKDSGCSIKQIGEVKPAVMPPPVAPPIPIAAAPVFTPEELLQVVGLEDLRNISEPPLLGQGFNLAIIDTGIRETHEKINGRVVLRRNFTASTHQDGFDHGTGVAGIALTLAPLANILDFKVLDNTGQGSEEEVVMAIDEAISMRDEGQQYAPHVINLSLGAPDDGDPFNPLRVACRAAIDRGIWVFAAVGNNGPNPGTIMTPGCERYVVAVGSAAYFSAENTFMVSNFSSRGPTLEGLTKPDAVLFGESIAMASAASDSAMVAKSGTSFATPFASAMGLLYHEGILAYGGVRYPEGPPPGLYPEITDLISVQQMLDVYLPGLCIKPQGIQAMKDYDYGCGIPFGPLMMRALSPTAATSISSYMPMLSTFMMLGMMGMMMKGAMSNGRNSR